MAVWERTDHFEGLRSHYKSLPSQGCGNHLDERSGQMGNVAEGLVFDLFALPVSAS